MSRSAVRVYGRKSCPPCMRTKKLREQGAWIFCTSTLTTNRMRSLD